jgi:tRNA pseudouridine65 synthase
VNAPLPLPLLYQDDHYVAVDKPPGLLVHRTPQSRDRVFVLQRLRDQLGRRLYPVHRLDRATSGVLVLGLSSEAAARLGQAFTERRVRKTYLAVVRGHTAASGRIDHPLAEDGVGDPQPALTEYTRLGVVTLPIAVGRYPEARYSLLEVHPRTGRMHQIRRHLKHVFHPLVGDTTYGEGRHNRLFREHFGVRRLLLHAHALAFEHPFGGGWTTVAAPPDAELAALFARLGWTLDAAPPSTVEASRL